MNGLYHPETQQALQLIAKIGEEQNKAFAATMQFTGAMAQLGYPTMITGASEAPYDILGDYFRGTLGIFEDITDEDVLPYVEETVNRFADMQITRLQYLRFLDLPFKCVFFPLHKGMDGFMSDKHYETLYWKPLKNDISLPQTAAPVRSPAAGSIISAKRQGRDSTCRWRRRNGGPICIIPRICA